VRVISNRFNGTFDGDGHTITVNYGSAEAPLTEEVAAPFRYIMSPTIKNLHVTGHIYTSAGYAAGIVGNVKDEVHITTCRSSVVITGTQGNYAYYGGLVSIVESGKVTITDCLFDGQLLGNGNSKRCGGFVGGNPKKVEFKNCLFAPSAAVTVGSDDSYTFCHLTVLGSNPAGTADFDNSYYKTVFGTVQGTDASGMTDEQLATALGSMWEVKDSKISLRMADFGTRMDFATIDGIQPAYKYTGGTIDISAYTVKNYYGSALTEGTDYNVTLKRDGAVASEVKEEGLYSLELSGISPYTETKVVQFLVAAYPDALSVDPDYEYGDAGVLYVNMPASGSGSVDLTGYSSDLTFKIYDDGGKNNNCSLGCNSTFTVKAPAGYAVKLTGNVDALKASDVSYLTVYNGTETTDANHIGNEKYGTTGGENIGTLVSGQTMTLKFTTIGSPTTFPGLNLTVTFVPSLSEADGITTAIAAEIAGKQVNFTRSFANGVASTICLPFPMTGLAENTVYEMTSMDKTGEDWVATMTNVTSTDAGKPYLVKTQADGAVQFSGTVPNDFDGTAGTSSATYNGDGSWTFRGTYTTLTYGTNLTGAVYGFAGAAYGLNSVKAGDFVKAETGAYVSPFRCYLTYNAPSSARGMTRGADIELPSRIIVRLVDSNGQTTAIGSMDTKTGEVVFGDAWYSLDGRRIQGQPTKKGMYINNGHKIIIK
ncbi:MAG: hypothetical protein J6W38_04660, partial [Prevotella sp.]|nr:hypothetical protein [Prevotella sp.]